MLGTYNLSFYNNNYCSNYTTINTRFQTKSQHNKRELVFLLKSPKATQSAKENKLVHTTLFCKLFYIQIVLRHYTELCNHPTYLN